MSAETKQKVTDLLKRVIEKVKDVRPKNLVEIPTSDIYIMGMYWRSVSLFEAIAVLLEEELVEEALMLARSLFVEALRLAELTGSEKERTALVLGWANYSIEQKKGLIHDAVRIGLEENPDEVLGQLEQEQQKLQNYQRRRGIGSLRKFLSEGNAALKFDRKDDYWAYVLGHQMVHGTDAAYLFRRRKLKDDTVAVFAKTNEIKVLGGAAFFAARSVLQATQSVVDIFNWTDDGGLKKLLSYKKL